MFESSRVSANAVQPPAPGTSQKGYSIPERHEHQKPLNIPPRSPHKVVSPRHRRVGVDGPVNSAHTKSTARSVANTKLKQLRKLTIDVDFSAADEPFCPSVIHSPRRRLPVRQILSPRRKGQARVTSQLAQALDDSTLLELTTDDGPTLKNQENKPDIQSHSSSAGAKLLCSPRRRSRAKLLRSTVAVMEKPAATPTIARANEGPPAAVPVPPPVEEPASVPTRTSASKIAVAALRSPRRSAVSSQFRLRVAKYAASSRIGSPVAKTLARDFSATDKEVDRAQHSIVSPRKAVRLSTLRGKVQLGPTLLSPKKMESQKDFGRSSADPSSKKTAPQLSSTYQYSLSRYNRLNPPQGHRSQATPASLPFQEAPVTNLRPVATFSDGIHSFGPRSSTVAKNLTATRDVSTSASNDPGVKDRAHRTLDRKKLASPEPQHQTVPAVANFSAQPPKHVSAPSSYTSSLTGGSPSKIFSATHRLRLHAVALARAEMVEETSQQEKKHYPPSPAKYRVPSNPSVSFSNQRMGIAPIEHQAPSQPPPSFSNQRMAAYLNQKNKRAQHAKAAM
jgi:hypothetical protein